MRRLSLRRRTYLALCLLACAMPLALVLIQFAFDLSPSDDSLLAGAGNLAAGVLTYPAGLVGSIAFFIPVVFGLLTPTEAVLFAAPFYIAAGYWQWYVLVPGHFRVRVKDTE